MTSLAVALAAPSASDTRSWVTAVVTAVDTAEARVTVELEDGTLMRYRRLAGPYRPGDTVVVLRDPDRTGAGPLVLGVVTTTGPAWSTGIVTAINAGALRITASLPDGSSVTAPYAAGTYTVGGTVIVLLDVAASGAGPLILGPLGNPPAAPPAPLPPVVSPGGPTVQEATALIRPTWSGTWRATRSAWDRWNESNSSYGGRSTLYQGSGSGSGALTGLATYGDQIVGLGASEILEVAVTITRVDQGWDDRTTTLQCAVEGSQPGGAPTLTGSTVTTGAIPGGATTQAYLDASQREALRTGAAKSLATVGSSYGAVFGTGRGDGMALAIRFRRTA